MPVPARINLVTLGVFDIPRSRSFYSSLGWVDANPQDQSVAFLQLGPLVLALWGRAELAADAKLTEPGTPGAVSLAINLGSPEEVDAVYAEALAAGASALKSPERTFWGGYSGYFGDPDGHPWELAHNPFWELQPDGSVRLP